MDLMSQKRSPRSPNVQFVCYIHCIIFAHGPGARSSVYFQTFREKRAIETNSPLHSSLSAGKLDVNA